MPLTQSIPKTTIPAGDTTFQFATKTVQPWSTADVTLDRTGSPSSGPWLNNLTVADVLTLDIQYSTDSGATWTSIAGASFAGGVLVTAKTGVVVVTSEFTVGIGHPFPVGSEFQVVAAATTPIQLSGSVTYA